MSAQPYIPLYVGDWEKDTNCLSLQAEAAWLKIILKMWKQGKTGEYKTSTKVLQNLWRTSEAQVKEIISELKIDGVGGIIEKDEEITFVNRRMKKEYETSKKRSQAVQTRYKPSTNSLQTHDIDNDIEVDNENKNVIILPFGSENFKLIWDTWIKYRKEIKRPYKGLMSEQAVLKKLSHYEEAIAIKMIEESISNQWQGIFPLKENSNGKSTGQKKSPLRAASEAVLATTSAAKTTTHPEHREDS